MVFSPLVSEASPPLIRIAALNSHLGGSGTHLDHCRNGNHIRLGAMDEDVLRGGKKGGKRVSRKTRGIAFGPS